MPIDLYARQFGGTDGNDRCMHFSLNVLLYHFTSAESPPMCCSYGHGTYGSEPDIECLQPCSISFCWLELCLVACVHNLVFCIRIFVSSDPLPPAFAVVGVDYKLLASTTQSSLTNHYQPLNYWRTTKHSPMIDPSTYYLVIKRP